MPIKFNQKSRQFYLYYCLFFLFLFFKFTSQALANLQVSPAIKECFRKNGENFSGVYTVANITGQQLEVNIAIEDWQKRMLNKDNGYLLDSWLFFPQKLFSLAPKEVKEIPYQVQVPKNLEGELVVQIFFESLNSASMKTRVGTIFYLTAKDFAVIEAKVEAVDLIHFSQDGRKELKAEIVVHNQGNVHIRPKGRLIFLKEGKYLKSLVFSGMGIYPGESKRLSCSKAIADLPAGKYLVKVVLDIGHTYKVNKKILWEQALF